ncbi:MAG: transcription-repair coupling factor, partial [Planctomycetota bacterium]|nr:transcription-repair coupling factor [Planctomycetota bacterium]
MADAELSLSPSDRLMGLVGHLAEQDAFEGVIRELKMGHAGTFDGVWGSSCALLAAALANRCGRTLVVVCPTEDLADDLLDDFTLFSKRTAERFPALEALSGDRLLLDEVFGQRIRLLKQLGGSAAPPVVVTSIAALLQPVPSGKSLAMQTWAIRTGARIGVEDLTRWLVENEFHRTSAVELPGEFAVRGGLLDIFAPDWQDPVRVEFFGDQVESLRRFEIASQRSLATLERIDLTMLSPTARYEGHLADHLPAESWFLLVEPEEMQEAGRHYAGRVERPDVLHGLASVLGQVVRFPSATASAIAASSLEATCRLKIESVERFSGDTGKVREELDAIGFAQEVFLICPTEAETRRLADVFGSTRLAGEGRLHFARGELREGFRLASAQVLL